MSEFFGQKINNTRVVPVTLKIVILFTLFILISNLSSNYVNLILNRAELTKLEKQLLIKDLKSINEFCNTQYEIYLYTKDLPGSVVNITDKGLQELRNSQAIVLTVNSNKNIFSQSSRANSQIKKYATFQDEDAFNKMKNSLANGSEQGFLNFKFNNEAYFGIYKYNTKWNFFILRAEEFNQFYAESRRIFKNISIIIILITLASAIVGIILLQYILRFIGIITSHLMQMSQNQQMELIDLKGAPNDDITFLGIAFNSLSNTIDNLITIFRKFATRDIAIKAYQEHEIRLEGAKQNLTILFSDIKSFTFITETLGNDIIKLLNMHYDKAIREIHNYNGIVGSIIGDAILAIFGTLDDGKQNKSYEALLSAYKIQEVALSLRDKMDQRKKEIENQKGKLSEDEEKVYRAVLLEVGVGIDGGEVFYGNIGSYVRMTNTVIGDNVNSASRLEGLTRIYKTPVICSEYVKNDIEKNVPNNKITFVEIDRVQVKGKTEGKTIYWPILEKDYTPKLKKNLNDFSIGLKLYYKGEWKKAYQYFKNCPLSIAQVFVERTKNNTSPARWDGIWSMKTK